MLTSVVLLGVLATPSWSLSPFTVSNDDLHAIVGLIAGVAILSLWVALEHFRQTRRRNQSDTIQVSEASEVREPDALLAAMPPGAGIAVPARAEWLLDDNTLVRMHAVPRGSLTPLATSQPESRAIDTGEPQPAADATGTDPTTAPMGDNNDTDDTDDTQDDTQDDYPL